ncbi:hypothetical protein [Microcoleus sp.]|uniref:hypothetical protein n=1 Tax=Microcoleus sp. TaxID=44472 RepID=UPI00403E9D46
MFKASSHTCLKFVVTILFAAILWVGFNLEVSAQPIIASCPAPYQIKWPTNAPVWSLCWTPPDKSGGVDGSGLEVYNVYYKGKQVLHRANLPVLNVQYAPGGCGGPSLSYRDWQNQLQPFEANNVLQPGYAEPTISPKTTCDHPGSDAGSFSGVTVEKKPDKLILTTQMTAGWYRYVQKWIFFPDGTIQPQFGFSAVAHPCVDKSHTHHAYWRLDFDIEGAGNDRIDEFNNGIWAALPAENNRLKSPISQRKWRMMDAGTNRGYEIVPLAGQSTQAGDAFAISDTWALSYKSNERDDGGAASGDNRAQMNKFINGETLNGKDDVLWYHISYQHGSGPTCSLLGPVLRPVGSW